jgi:succinate dehydrogenase flavin-adding protein (antitoxin of CptAB toxin-antitoxin module)
MAAQKLTLSIEPAAIDKAKKYAKQKHTSLSKMVQGYFNDIATANDPDISDWVKQLVIADKPTPDFDNKAEYRKHIIEKYS